MVKCICSGLTPTQREVTGDHHAEPDDRIGGARCPMYRRHSGDAMARLHAHRDEARDKAIDSLSRYKFSMFGYWAAIWVHLNQVIGDRSPSPFKHLVEAAKKGAVNANA